MKFSEFCHNAGGVSCLFLAVMADVLMHLQLPELTQKPPGQRKAVESYLYLGNLTSDWDPLKDTERVGRSVHQGISHHLPAVLGGPS